MAVTHRERRPLLRTRRIDLQKIEQVIRADIPQPACVENGKDPVFPYRFVKRADEVILWNGPDSEELFHQLVLAFGDQLDQSFMRSLGVVFEHVRDRSNGAASVAIRRIKERLHGDEIDHSVEPMLIHDRQLYRDNLPAPSRAHCFQHIHPAGT